MYKCIKLIAAVMAATMMLMLNGCGGKNVLTIGISAKDKPLSSRGANGQPTGYIVELSREAGRRMGMDVKFKYVDMSAKSKNFYTQGIDVLWGKIISTGENRKTMLFTRDYLSDKQIIIVNSDSAIENENDLKGKKIGAVKNSDAERALLKTSLLKDAEDGTDVKFNSPEAAFIALDKLQIDALAIDYTYASHAIAEHAEQYRILSKTLSAEKYAVALRRNDASLRDKLEKVLEEMENDGISDSISKKWFGTDLT